MMHHKHYFYQQLIKQFEPLLHKTLLRLGITKRHLYYEDYYQELCLKICHLADHFDGQALGPDRFRFTAYAGTGLYWHLIDLVRRTNRIKEAPYEKFNEYMENIPSHLNYYSSSASLLTFLNETEKRLTSEEYRLFWLLFDEEISVTEIALLLGVSRKTIYKRRNKIQKKLMDIKHFLEKE